MAPVAKTNGPSGSTYPVARYTYRMDEPRKTYQEKRSVKCDYPAEHLAHPCHAVFETYEDMMTHKHKDPDHFYCRRCDKRQRNDKSRPPGKPFEDFNFEDWDALISHKVHVMAPFVDRRVKATDDNPPLHILCEFCGEDFGSFGGRKIHRETMHPADQNIKCPGCDMRFVRAANMVDHLEKNQCLTIRAIDFYRNIKHKQIIKQLMGQPHRLIENLSANKLPPPKFPGRIIEGSELEEQEDGGVSLLDQLDEAQMGGYKSLVPETNLIDLHGHNEHHSRQESWPRLPDGDATSQLASSVRSMSISSTTRSINIGSTYTGRRMKLASRGEHIKEFVLDDEEEDDAASQTTSTAVNSPPPGSSTVWGSSTTEKLFPYSKDVKNVEKASWDSLLKARIAESQAGEGTNMLKVRWWDPTSKDYNIDIFFHEGFKVYLCPFQSCEHDNLTYQTPDELHEHMGLAHTRIVYGCPSCQKRFSSPTGLVAHAETTRKCFIRKSEAFGKFISDITGGYLDAQDNHVPKICHTDNYIKEGEQSSGIMPVKFSGQNPDDD